MTLVFIATAWGPKYGGINSFNTELCKAFPTILPKTSYTIFCFCDEVSGKDVQYCNTKGIKLYQIDKHGKNETEQVTEIISTIKENGDLEVAWWFGHDVITGDLAKHCKDSALKGQLAIFHHMNYLGYSGYKYENGGEVLEWSNKQEKILRSADVVFAIGPKLYESANSLLNNDNKDKIFEVIPGFIEILPSEQNIPFRAIVVGRLGNEDDVIKQFRLSVAAFGRAMHKHSAAFPHDPTIILFGANEDEVKELNKSLSELALKHAKRLVNVLVVPFTTNQETITKHLRSSWVCLMLSLHEGFGLAGWEAIAAEVPLIVSENSGLYQYVNQKIGNPGSRGSLWPVDIKGSMGEEHYSDEDVDNVANQLASISLTIKNARKSSKYLKNELSCTWETTALQVSNGCSLRSILIAGENPGEYVQEILKSSDAFDELVSKRKTHFEQIFERIDHQATEMNRLVLFGGISTMLREDEAIQKYAIWLIRNPNASLYMCYETGLSAKNRALTLDVNLINDGSKNLEERMHIKEQQVLSLKDKFEQLVGIDVFNRIYFIPLSMPLTNYTIICGNELYVTPVLHGRSSQSESIRLPSKSSPYRTQFLEYMLFHLSNNTKSGEVDALTNEINSAKVID